MSKTLNQKIAEIKSDTATTALVPFNQQQTSAGRDEALLLLGGIKATQAQAEHNYAQSMRAVQHFANEKYYERFGFKDFATFLDEFEYSPFTKNEYYNRLKLLNQEGEEAFNLLSSLRISLATRRALKKGEIQVEGDTVRIGDEEIPLTETQRIKTILKTLSDRTAQQKQAIEKGKAELKAKTKQLDELATGASVRASEDSDSEPGQIYMRVLSGFANLEREIAALSPAQQKVLIGEFTPGLKLALQSFVLFGLGEKQPATDDLDDLLAQAADEADD